MKKICMENQQYLTKPVLYSLELPQGSLEMAAIPTEGWQQSIQVQRKIFLVLSNIIGLLIAIMIYIILFRNAKLKFAVKQKTKQLNESYVLLREKQKLESIGTLAGGVAHEINNPINGIMNYSQLILDSDDIMNEAPEYAKEIISESERVAKIVKDLLLFSRVDKQGFNNVNIDDIIDQTLSLIRMVIKRDQIDLQVDISKNIPNFNCRSQQLQQVLMNLLTNARDALNQKYEGYDENKVIKISCKTFKKEKKDWIRITVEDQGNGISASAQENIFDPFFSTKDRTQGTGLGLYISYGIVKEHHGELTFETEEGSYTRFFLDLPVGNCELEGKKDGLI